MEEKGAGKTRLPSVAASSPLVLFRLAKNDTAACDREQVELQGQVLAVLVLPCRADAVPELVFLRAPEPSR